MVVNTFNTFPISSNIWSLLFILPAVYPDVNIWCSWCSNTKLNIYLPDVRFNECHQICPGFAWIKQLALVNEVSDGCLAGASLLSLSGSVLVTPGMMRSLVTMIMGGLARRLRSPLSHHIGPRSEVRTVLMCISIVF